MTTFRHEFSKNSGNFIQVQIPLQFGSLFIHLFFLFVKFKILFSRGFFRHPKHNYSFFPVGPQKSKISIHVEKSPFSFMVPTKKGFSRITKIYGYLALRPKKSLEKSTTPILPPTSSSSRLSMN